MMTMLHDRGLGFAHGVLDVHFVLPCQALHAG